MKIKCYRDFEIFAYEVMTEFSKSDKFSDYPLIECRCSTSNLKLYTWYRYFIEICYSPHKNWVELTIASSFDNRIVARANERVDLYCYYGGNKEISLGRFDSVKELMERALAWLDIR